MLRTVDYKFIKPFSLSHTHRHTRARALWRSPVFHSIEIKMIESDDKYLIQRARRISKRVEPPASRRIPIERSIERIEHIEQSDRSETEAIYVVERRNEGKSKR